jgi:hypothetical protein
MTGTLERGVDPKGPELYVDADHGAFPVAVASNTELELLRTWVGQRVTFKPKTFGTRTNETTGKVEAIVFATDIWKAERAN